VTERFRHTPQFYLTAATPCPYLPGQYERKVFTHLVGERASELNDVLSQGGFRRSQNIAYRPACEGCRACVSVRVLADAYAPSRSQQRVARRNRDLIAIHKPCQPTSEQFSVFRAYLDARHADGGMADMTVLDYAMMVEDTFVDTNIIEYRLRDPDSGVTGNSKGRLVGVALSDMLADGLSMVYSFFRPEEARRSLGTYMVMEHIERARRLGLPYVYLGYWVKGSRKMDYKAGFLPQERLNHTGWRRITTKDGV